MAPSIDKKETTNTYLLIIFRLCPLQMNLSNLRNMVESFWFCNLSLPSSTTTDPQTLFLDPDNFPTGYERHFFKYDALPNKTSPFIQAVPALRAFN